MGRVRLPMKLIADEKGRRNAYAKRINSMKKKVYELHTLCDIDVFFVVFPQHDTASSSSSSSSPVAWPDDPSELRRIMQRYEGLDPITRKWNSQNLPMLFVEMSTKMQKQLHRQHPNAAAATVGDRSLDSLRKLVGELDVKIETINKRIKSLESNSSGGLSPSPSSKGKELVVAHDHHQQQQQEVMGWYPSYGFDMTNGVYVAGGYPYLANCFDGTITGVGGGFVGLQFLPMMGGAFWLSDGGASSVMYGHGMPFVMGPAGAPVVGPEKNQSGHEQVVSQGPL